MKLSSTFTAEPPGVVTVKRVYIEKANGKLRPLGIPTAKGRVVQCAVKLIIEPIFEADFRDCSYGFRPNRSAQQAVDRIAAEIKSGKTSVHDADLSSYFDTIPHDKLFLALRTRYAATGDKGLLMGVPEEDREFVTGIWPPEFERILNGESAAMIAQDVQLGKL